ncbi:DUF3576 domain-containing protein [Magnetofaba australis]|nr:DUF3576 domain-containing protein [Magnetofaba australis]
MQSRILRICLTLLMGISLSVAASGCSNKLWRSSNQVDKHKLAKFGQKKAVEDGKEDWMKVQSKADEGEQSTFSLGSGGIMGGGRALTAADIRRDKLFSGALDMVMELPIQTANRESGFVSTEWKVDPTDPTKRYRLNIRVSGVEPYGEVRVVVLKQVLRQNVWIDQPAEESMAAQIEKGIRKNSQITKM